MPAPPAHDVTRLLVAWPEGNKAAFEQLVPLVYAELREVAHGRMRDERPDHVLQTTALINEAYLRLIDINRVRWESRAHFFAISARIMRRILVDAARERDARKRGGEISHVVFDEALMLAPERDTDLVALDAALEALANADPRKSQVVELRYFGGLSVQETAEVLGVSVETVARDWRLATLWLLRELEQGKPERPDGARADCGADGRP